MQGFKLGMRAFSSFRVWLTIILWTLFYSDGAGLGAFLYHNNCRGSPLFYQPLLPPDVPITVFLTEAAYFWFEGFYYSGIALAFLLIILLMLLASRMDRYAVERIYSWPTILVGCLLAWPLGLYFEIHQTLVSGNSHCGLV